MAFAERILAPLTQLRGSLQRERVRTALDGVLQTSTSQPTSTTRQPAKATPENALDIACPDPTAEDRERSAHKNHAQRMIRQENWEDLVQELTVADQNRIKTTGGMPVAELLSDGARADVVNAVKHALISGYPERGAPIMLGIESLEMVLAEHPQEPIVANIVAQAHIDMGLAWRGTGWDVEVPERNREAFEAHFDRASDIVAPFDAKTLSSPLLAATKCVLNSGHEVHFNDIIRGYEAWIDLDPLNARALRAMGGDLMPCQRGSYEQLELAARRAAGQTYDIWGAGAYTWVMFDAISANVEACARLDLEFFLDGLQDILRNTRDQHTVNILAAYCANTMGATHTGHDSADYIRAQVANAAEWIVRDHLVELHPLVWAHAARGFDNASRVRCMDRFAEAGYAEAVRYLTELFQTELAAGQRIVFTENGAEAHAI